MNDGIKRKQVRPNPKQNCRNGDIDEKEIKDREKLRRAGEQIATKLTSQRNVTFKVSSYYSQNIRSTKVVFLQSNKRQARDTFMKDFLGTIFFFYFLVT